MKEYYIIGQDFDDGMKWYFIKDYTNEEQPVSHYDYTEDKAEAQVFESYEDALDTLMSVHNFQDVCISDGGDDFAPVEDWKIAYYDESGALYDGRTGKFIVNYDGVDGSDTWYVYTYDDEKDLVFIRKTEGKIKPVVGYKGTEEKPTVTTTDIIKNAKTFNEEDDAETFINWIKHNYVILDDELVDVFNLRVCYKDLKGNLCDSRTNKYIMRVDESMEFNEARKFLNENGYQLIDEALEGPATSKQLWTLFKLTHKDYRGQDLSKQAASDMIGELLGKKKNGDTTLKPRKAPASDENSPVKVGEIYHRSWGYDMTINTYFKVLSVKGKSAMVIELDKDVVDGCMQQGHVVASKSPEKGAVPQKALIKDDGTIKVKHYSDKYETYRKWDGKPDYEDHMD